MPLKLGFNPNASTEDVIQSSSSFKTLDLPHKMMSKTPTVEKPFDYKEARFDVSQAPKTTGATTGAGTTSVASGTQAIAKASIAPAPKVNLKETAVFINNKRNTVGLAPIKPKETSVYQEGSVVDNISKSLDASGDWIRDIVSTDYKTKDKALTKVSDIVGEVANPILSTVGRVLDFSGKNMVERPIASTGLVVGGLISSASWNASKLIKDSTEFLPKAIENYKKGKDVGEGLISKGYGFGEGLIATGFEDKKNQMDYLFGVDTGNLDASSFYESRQEVRDRIKGQFAMDSFATSQLEKMDGFAMAIDISSDLISGLGVAKGVSTGLEFASKANSPILKAAFTTLGEVANPSFSKLAKIGASTAIADAMTYSITGKRLGEGDKAAEAGRDILEIGGALGIIVKGGGNVVDYIKSNKEAQALFKKGYIQAMDIFTANMKDVRSQRGSIQFGKQIVETLPKDAIDTNNIKELVNPEKVTKAIRQLNPDVTDPQIIADAVAMDIATTKGIAATVNKRNGKSIADKLKLEGFLEEGKDSFGDVFKAQIKKVGASDWKIWNRHSWVQYLQRQGQKEVNPTPDIYMKQVTGKVDFIYNKLNDIKKSLENTTEFQEFVTYRRQYNLVKEREEAIDSVRSQIDEAIARGESPNVIKDLRRQLEREDFQPRSVGSAGSGKEFMRRYENTYQAKESLYETQLDDLNKINDIVLDTLKDSGRISKEGYDELKKADVYVRTRFLFEEGIEGGGRADAKVGVIQKLKSGTSEGELDFAFFDNMISQYSKSMKASMENKTSLMLREITEANPSFKVGDESLGDNSIQFFENGEKKFLTGPKFFMDKMKRMEGITPDLISSFRDNYPGAYTLAQTLAIPTKMVKEMTTGRFTLFQLANVPFELLGGWVNSMANNKGAFDFSQSGRAIGRLVGISDKENEAIEFLAKWTGVDSANVFATDMKGLLGVDNLEEILSKSLSDIKVKNPTVGDIFKDSIKSAGKPISFVWHGAEKVLSAAETKTSRMGAFAGYIKYQMGEVGMSMDDFIKIYDELKDNPQKFQKFLESKGLDPDRAAELTVDQFNYNKAVDAVQLLNRYIHYLSASIEGPRKFFGNISDIGVGAGKELGKLGSGQMPESFHYLTSASKLIGIGGAITYPIYQFNNTEERRKMALYDPNPEKLGFYIGWDKDPKTGRLLVNEKIIKIEINAMPDAIWSVALGFYVMYNKINSLSIPNGDRILANYVSSKTSILKWSEYNGVSISSYGPIINTIIDYNKKSTNVTEKTSSAAVVLAHYSDGMTPPQIDRMISDVFSKRSNDVKNLMVDTFELFGVDVNEITKDGVTEAQETKLSQWFGQETFAKGFSRLIGDMVKVNLKETGAVTDEELKVMKEAAMASTEKTTESQLISQKIDKAIEGWADMNKEERLRVLSSIKIPGVSPAEVFKKVVERSKLQGKSSIEQRIGGLTSENYYNIVLGKVDTKEGKLKKLVEDYKAGLVSKSKAETIFEMVNKE